MLTPKLTQEQIQTRLDQVLLKATGNKTLSVTTIFLILYQEMHKIEQEHSPEEQEQPKEQEQEQQTQKVTRLNATDVRSNP